MNTIFSLSKNPLQSPLRNKSIFYQLGKKFDQLSLPIKKEFGWIFMLQFENY